MGNSYNNDYDNQTIIENITETMYEEYILNRDPLHIVLPLTVIYCIIFITGIVGNVSTCVVIARNKHMHTATNYYLFSLAVSDILLLLSGLPAETFNLWSKHIYVFGESFCILQGFVAETSANATVLTITAFTVERYVAICHPFRSHSLSKLSRAVRLIVVIWIVSMLLATPLAIQFGVTTEKMHHLETTHCTIKSVLFDKAFILSSCVVFVLPMTVITVLYVLIGLKLRLSGRMTGNRPSVNNDREASRPKTSSHQKHVIKMLVAVVVTFFICWAPFHAQRLFAMHLNGENISSQANPTLLVLYASLNYVSGILYYLSTTVNPLLYNIMSHKFRLAFKSTLSRTCSIRHCQQDKRSPYGTVRVGSQRTINGSLPRRSGPTEATTVLMTVRSVRKTRVTHAVHNLDPSEGNNNRFHLAQGIRHDQSTNLNAKSAATCLSCADRKHKGDNTFSSITRKIRAIPAKGIFCNRNLQETDKGIALGSHTISNSSLLDLDLSEYTSSELAEIIGQMKTDPSRGYQEAPTATDIT